MQAVEAIEFSVTFLIEAHTNLGDTIHIVGSSQELGNWNPGFGVPLTTRPGLYPQWTATVRFQGTSWEDIVGFEYKYVIDCRSREAGFKWESLPNREFKFPALPKAAKVVDGAWLVWDSKFDSSRIENLIYMPACIASSAEPFDNTYELNEKLGSGAFGTVWRCCRLQREEPKADCSLAAKQVQKLALKQRDAFNLFGADTATGEINIHLTQKHRHIIELFEVFDEPTQVTLVLNMSDGGDLFTHVADCVKSGGVGVSERSARVVLEQLLSALEYIHKQHIVHRDVKCENVLLQYSGVPLEANSCKLCDFGLAKRLPASGVLREPVGSLLYLAPEVVAKPPSYSTPADLWAAGVVLHFMLSGKQPFYASTDREVILKIRNGDYSLEGDVWHKLSTYTKTQVRSLVTIDQRRRMRTAEALLRTAEALLRHVQGCASIATTTVQLQSGTEVGSSKKPESPDASPAVSTQDNTKHVLSVSGKAVSDSGKARSPDASPGTTIEDDTEDVLTVSGKAVSSSGKAGGPDASPATSMEDDTNQILSPSDKAVSSSGKAGVAYEPPATCMDDDTRGIPSVLPNSGNDRNVTASFDVFVKHEYHVVSNSGIVGNAEHLNARSETCVDDDVVQADQARDMSMSWFGDYELRSWFVCFTRDR